jgi:hypothetical protein
LIPRLSRLAADFLMIMPSYRKWSSLSLHTEPFQHRLSKYCINRFFVIASVHDKHPPVPAKEEILAVNVGNHMKTPNTLSTGNEDVCMLLKRLKVTFTVRVVR